MLYEAIFRHVAVQARHVSDNRHYVLFAQTRAIRARVRIRAGEAPSDRVGLLRESPPSLITARPFRAATEWPRYTPPLVFAPYDRVHGACSRTASPAPAQLAASSRSGSDHAPIFGRRRRQLARRQERTATEWPRARAAPFHVPTIAFTGLARGRQAPRPLRFCTAWPPTPPHSARVSVGAMIPTVSYTRAAPARRLWKTWGKLAFFCGKLPRFPQPPCSHPLHELHVRAKFSTKSHPFLTRFPQVIHRQIDLHYVDIMPTQ